MASIFILPIAAMAVVVTEKLPIPPANGARVPDFTLMDVHGQAHSLSDYKDKKAIVIVFIGTECPLANLYLPTLAELHKQFAGRCVQFLAINSNNQDSYADVVAHERERRLPFPVLKDSYQKAADTLGARRTPEAFVLDSGNRIRYRGRIDDQYGYSFRRAAPAHTELKDAIQSVLAGQPVRTTQTAVQGCVIGRGRPDATDNSSK
jgi:peroxiredoxin